MALPENDKSPCQSDITDRQWKQIEPLLPGPYRIGRNRDVSRRAIINAINYRWNTGCTWRKLPKKFPPWSTVHCYHRQWEITGVLQQIKQILEQEEC